MSLTPQEEYVEAGYFVDDDYVGGIAEGVVGISPYVVEDYIEAGYFIPGGGAFVLIADLTQAIEEAGATLTVSSSLSSTALRIKTSPVQLSWQATLLSQGAIVRGFDSTLNSVAQIGHLENGGIGSNVLPAVTYTGAAEVVSTSSLSADALLVVLFESELTTNASAAANAIEYQLRPNTFNRPINFIQSDNRVPTTTGGVEGGYSASNSDETLISEALGADLPNDFLLMFNYYTYHTDTDEEIMTYGDPSSPVIRVRRDSPSSGSNRLEFVFASSTGNDTLTLTDTDGRIFPPNAAGWSTIFIARKTADSNTTTTVKVIVDGDIQRTASANSVTIGTLNLPSSANRKFGFAVTGNNGFRVDDFVLYDRSYTNELNQWGLDPNTASTYTQPPNDADAIMYHRFNGDLLDETGIVFEDTLELTAISSATGTGTYSIGNISAELDAINSTLIASVKTGSAVASLDAVAGFSSVVVKVVEGVCNIECSTQMGTTGSVTSSGAGTLTSVASLSVAPTKTASGAVDLNASAGLDASVTGFTGTSALLDSVASLSAEATRIKSISADFASSFALVTDLNRLRLGDATASSVAGVVGEATRIHPLSASLSGIAASVTVAVKSGFIVASLDNTTSLSATPNAEFIFEASLPTIATTTVEAVKKVEVGASLTSTAQISGDATVTVGVTSELEFTSVSTVTALVVKSTSAVVLTNSSASLSVDPEYLRPAGGELTSSALLSAEAVKNTSGDAELSLTTGLVAEAGKLKITTANISGAFSASVLARTILTTLAVHVIPRETRSHSIVAENKHHTITRENRTHKVLEGA